jgi:glutaminase
MDYQELLEEIHHEVKPLLGKGKVADYIPALGKINGQQLGISLHTLNGEHYGVGDYSTCFSIQSISKVFTLALAMQVKGEEVWQRVGREPSGNPFNSLVQLEYEHGKPRNPFINAGALVISDILVSRFQHPQEAILQFVRKQANDSHIIIDGEVLSSEQATGFTNAALANYLKSHGNLNNEVASVLATYFAHCSIRMNSEQLSQAFLFLANHGKDPLTGEELLTRSQAKRLNAVMLTCGCYDEAGDFAYRVGLPGKSGVGGGIVAVIPERCSLAVWSPELNSKGNSLAGMKALELFTTKTGISVF